MQSPLPQNNQHSKKRRVWPPVFGAAIAFAIVLAWANQQFVADSVKYLQYDPVEKISSLTDRIKLTDRGKFVFYATQPQLDGSAAFNGKCSRKEENAAILGCYVIDQDEPVKIGSYDNDRIYLYDVTDERLNGIKEVTAAHEMLHAAYQRLSFSQRDTVDKLIEQEFAKLKDDKDLAERMAFYARTEPGERDNELHSIIGTEVKDISQELEAHYAEYFADRGTIVGYYEEYHQEFAALESQRAALSAQLDALSKSIESKKAAYALAAQGLEQSIASFNKRAQDGAFSSQAQFNRERAALVAGVSAASNQRDEINGLIDKFNDLRDEYNATVTKSNDLYKSMDSNLAPAPQV